ncbi:MAG: hypothetical protein Q8Q95_03405 [bacterium]|nr:hypothetical protein [bacterium]
MDKNTLLYFAKSFWAVTTLIFVALGLIFIFWFMIVRAKTDFLQKNDEYNVLAAKRAGTFQISRDREVLEVLGQRLDNSFVDKDKFVEFIEFIEAMARNTENSINLSNISEGDNIQNFKIVLGGSYSAAVNFIARLENSPYLVRLISISMSDAGVGGQVKTNLDIQIQLP